MTAAHETQTKANDRKCRKLIEKLTMWCSLAMRCLSTFPLAFINSHMYKINKNTSPIKQLGSTEYCLKWKKDVDAFNLLFTQNVLITIQHQTERERKYCQWQQNYLKILFWRFRGKHWPLTKNCHRMFDSWDWDLCFILICLYRPWDTQKAWASQEKNTITVNDDISLQENNHIYFNLITNNTCPAFSLCGYQSHPKFEFGFIS